MDYSELTYEDYLKHYGVKGMRWGRRRARPVKDRHPTKRQNGSTSNNQRRSSRGKKIALAAISIAGGVAVGYAGRRYVKNRKAGRLAAQESMRKVAKMSLWEMAAHADKVANERVDRTYKQKTRSRDEKVYGPKAAAKIAKDVYNGASVKEARARANTRHITKEAGKGFWNLYRG